MSSWYRAILLALVIIGHGLLFLAIRGVVAFSQPTGSEVGQEGFGEISLSPLKKTEDPVDKSILPASEVPPPSIIPIDSPANAEVIIPKGNSTLNVRVPVPPAVILSSSWMTEAGTGRAGGAGAGSGTRDSTGSETRQSGDVFGMAVQSDGEILAFIDTSESLKKVRALVVAELKKQLPSCTVTEVNGCLFSTRPAVERLNGSNLPSYLVSYYLTLVDGSVIPRITEEINEGRIDKPMAIYYFSDFEDYVDDKDTDEFSKLLQDHSIRFYAHSVEKEPADAVKRLCTDTGGAWTIKALKVGDNSSVERLSATSSNN